MDRKSLIIERTELQSARQKYGWGTITLLFWGIYVYLWLPLISLVLWSMGGTFLYEHMVVLGGYKGLVQLLGYYSLIIILMGIVFLSWAQINYWRFRDVERRRAQPPVSRVQQAEKYGIDAGALADWQYQTQLTIHLDENGVIQMIDAELE